MMCTETKNNHTSTALHLANGEGAPLLPTSPVNAAREEPSTSDGSLPPSHAAARPHKARLLLLLVAVLYGSLSVSLRAVYARPGPPAPSILSAVRGWMSILCLWPVAAVRAGNASRSGPAAAPAPRAFYGFALELALANVGTQGLLNVGLVTTASARSAFFTQLSVVITPVLAVVVGRLRRGKGGHAAAGEVGRRVWAACLLALLGLCILSRGGEGDADATAARGGGSAVLLSFGDWCCLGSGFCWSYYIFRLSDWGDRYDETQTMLYKNVFMALLYSLWTLAAYCASDECADADAAAASFCLWGGWRDPVALAVLFYTAASSGSLCDVLQQTAQARLPAAESNVILSLEPVAAAGLALLLLREIPSPQECVGGAFIIGASVLAAST